ncbi:MAG: cytidine deaminase [Chthonomonas sp.]|nr:cytidine deaminase [Chthonomonas sp.]
MNELARLAQSVQAHAYAPYSGYRVGAALRSASGQVFTGANFENLSFGATICAERNAVGAMITSGETKIAELVVATEDAGPPCGLCLQVLSEFATSDLPITLVNGDGKESQHTLAEFLPNAFASSRVKRVE